jgi:hypothetical protein
VALAALFAVGSFAPYETVRERLDAFASGHDADFNRERFDVGIPQRSIGAILLATAGAAALHRLPSEPAARCGQGGAERVRAREGDHGGSSRRTPGR